MAIYRQVRQSFWTDTKVVDDFTPEDRYFFLYLMTNPHTNLSGCYELSFKSASDETGYTRDTIERLITRLADVHKVIRYSKETKEVLIIKWSEYNWTKSPDFRKPLFRDIENVKNAEFKGYLMDIYDGVNTVSRPSKDTPETTVSVSVSVPVSDSVSVAVKEIVDYLNLKTGKNFSSKTKETQRHISARLSEGYTVADFKKVIDVKCDEWLNKPEMFKFLQPSTLFAPSHFDNYLNQAPRTSSSGWEKEWVNG